MRNLFQPHDYLIERSVDNLLKNRSHHQACEIQLDAVDLWRKTRTHTNLQNNWHWGTDFTRKQQTNPNNLLRKPLFLTTFAYKIFAVCWHSLPLCYVHASHSIFQPHTAAEAHQQRRRRAESRRRSSSRQQRYTV